MKHLYFTAALLAASALPMQAQNPFDQQTKAVYIWNVQHEKFLSDYMSPTPATYCLQDYGPSRAEAIVFELTTLNAVTGESVLYTPWTDTYMSVPAAGGFIGAKDVDKRSILTLKPSDDGHTIIYSGTVTVTPYKNGAFYLLAGYTESQMEKWGNIEECKWDIVDAENLEAFLKAHDIDPEYDPYVTPDPDPDPQPDPDPEPDKASFEDLQYAIIQAQEALLAAQGGIVAQGEGLITSADCFVSDYSDLDEGTDFEALIDGNTYTFWHSDWHGDAPDGDHSFDVLLPSVPQTTLLVAEYCGRVSGNNCSPIEMSIYGGTQVGDESRRTISDAPFTSLTRNDGLGAFAGWGHSANPDVLMGSFAFETDDFYNAYRFEANTVVSDAGEGVEACFNYSEFQLFAGQRIAPTVSADAADVEALAALIEVARTLTKTEDPTEAIAEIKAATEKITTTEGISSVLATLPSDARIYDLQGRRINLPASGLSIQNGKVVLR